jgi:hypothetical protein
MCHLCTWLYVYHHHFFLPKERLIGLDTEAPMDVGKYRGSEMYTLSCIARIHTSMGLKGTITHTYSQADARAYACRLGPIYACNACKRLVAHKSSQKDAYHHEYRPGLYTDTNPKSRL